MALQEDIDDTGDVISVNGQATDVEDKDAPATPEDRGDVVTDPDAPEEPKSAAKTDPEPEDHPTESSKPQTIPKIRFDEVNNRKNELAAELAEAQRQIEELRRGTAPKAATAEPAQATFDMEAKEKDYIEALMDGNAELAMSIRREINSQIVERATEQVEVKNQRRQEANALETVSTQAVTDYPYLDTPEGAEALELIIASRDAKISRGMQPAQALREAVNTIAPKFAPNPGDPPRRELTASETKTDTRATAAVARGAAASNLQPPSMQLGAGDRAAAGRVNVGEMSEEQFENLSIAEKKRLRGDQ